MIDESIKNKVTSNIKTQAATISKNTGAIFSILTESVYSDIMGAGIREIISNAVDANTRSKSNRPILISQPTKFNPVFSVRDFGPGLTHQEIYDLYTSVGESSKKQIEDEIGFFGIGAMSPFAYVDSFTVISYQNNKARTYSIFMTESGIPDIAYIKEDPTNNFNGLEVLYSVKTSDISTFNGKIHNTVKYLESTKWDWKDGGFKPAFYKDEIKASNNFVINIDDKYYISNKIYSYYQQNNNNSGNLVVMGGVQKTEYIYAVLKKTL
jgi:hypothetical protein